jgi:nicotinamidase-related amidase
MPAPTAAEIARIADPAHTALLTSECQEGIIGRSGQLAALVEAVRDGRVVENLRALLETARGVGVPVLHCTVVTRPDRGGSSANAPLLAFARQGKGGGLLAGSAEARVVAALGPADSDYVVARLHGVSPFHGTELDSILRSLGVRTVVATGVSLNVALLGLTFEAVNRGYNVVIPRDAVAGTPAEYAEALSKHTLRLLATLTTTAGVIGAWSGAASESRSRP